MNICITKARAKSKLLSFGIIPLCCAVGYLIGYLNTPSSNKAITQQAQFPSKVALPKTQLKVVAPKERAAIKISLIVKRSERQVYVYHGKQILNSFPIAVGKTGWETPLGNYQIFYMKKNPIFRNFNTGEVIKPGSNNPLGKRVIVFKKGKKFDLAFHGTNQDKLIGQAVSHGCIRMHNKEAIALYEMVDIGTPVTVLP
ncbi:L,D-transpeptidase [Microcoleus sp. Pol12A5]|uniref:L,D-transpeptidase n=1 Tax=Microcoleus sp. Pol12A5 TaxID=3055392 RepID=UPI002FD77E8B